MQKDCLLKPKEYLKRLSEIYGALTLLIIVSSMVLGYISPKDIYSPFFFLYLLFRLPFLYLSFLGVLLYFILIPLFILFVAIICELLFEVPIAYCSFIMGALASVPSRYIAPFFLIVLFDGFTSIFGLFLGTKINSPTRIIQYTPKFKIQVSMKQFLNRIKYCLLTLFFIVVFQIFSIFSIILY